MKDMKRMKKYPGGFDLTLPGLFVLHVLHGQLLSFEKQGR